MILRSFWNTLEFYDYKIIVKIRTDSVPLDIPL
jgi:hypothetical protein